VGVYRPEDWPVDGEGTIVARKRPDGKMAWYAGPNAGPRSDPNAFRVADPAAAPSVVWDQLPDGTITINGEVAHPNVQKMFGGRVSDAGAP
jgi:hypothetical protein